MHRAHLIDCHVLTLPRFDPQWVEELRKDLDGEPVNQHWLPGIDGRLGEARAAGYSLGRAPFVTSADPDDRIMPGTFAALLQALEDNPRAPFAWAGEQMVWEDLRALPEKYRHVWSGGYDPVLHVCRTLHVHGVKLYRRELVMPVLEKMRQAGQCCEFLLDFELAKPWANTNRSTWPIHVPVVGRLWRQHGQNGCRGFQPGDFELMARVLGFPSVNDLRDTVTRVCLNQPKPKPHQEVQHA